MNKFYIAYGSNMDMDQMALRCPDAAFVTATVLDGWRLMFKGSKTGSYATIERDPGCKVPALLWEISRADEARLDVYEGYPTFYYKQYIWVPEYGPAMAYIMHESRLHGVPSRRYYDLLDRAYKLFHWDRRVLRGALVYSKNRA